jgi:hypothetical protein
LAYYGFASGLYDAAADEQAGALELFVLHPVHAMLVMLTS